MLSEKDIMIFCYNISLLLCFKKKKSELILQFFLLEVVSNLRGKRQNNLENFLKHLTFF